MARVKSNGIELEYDTFGDPADPPMVLVMGLGAQLIDWPVDFCELLAQGGFYVVRFDNRDIGLSTGLDELGVPDLEGEPPYLLADLAEDTVGLFDALGFAKAHLVGASMGGMISQQVAVDHHDRLLSLASIMSTTGERSVGRPTPAAAAALGRPPAANREEAVQGAILGARVIGSPGFEVTDEEIATRARDKYDRSYRPMGTLRQYAAIVMSPDRTEGLRGVTIPTVVIHGEADPLVDVSGGRATAAAVPGADLLVIPGMGHDLPRGVRPQVAEAVIHNARKAL